MDSPDYAIDVDVATRFLDDQSAPEDGRYVFAYTIRIHNRGTMPARLISRHWRITDGDGRIQHVDGAGVIGKQPVLRPGARFEYSSGCPLTTPSGMMQGAYRFEDETGASIEATIPLFALDSPYDERRPN